MDSADSQSNAAGSSFVFPTWANYLLPLLLLGGAGAGLYLPLFAGAGLSASALNPGYQPTQPIAFSHALHAGELGMDCLYCHNTVDQASFAAVPPTQSCWNCHRQVHANSVQIKKLAAYSEDGGAVPWVKVHDLADYAYFNHSIHIAKGVGCVSCHGRIDQMEVVWQVENLSMSWCIDCHREPEKHLRPVEEVTNMAWTPAMANTTQEELGAELKKRYNIHDRAYMTSCSTCHR